MFNKTSRLIIVILALALVIAAVVIVIWQVNKRGEPTMLTVEEQEAQPALTEKLVIVNEELSDMEMQSQKVSNLSKDFAERFGSYSQTTGQENLETLDSLMTKNFHDWTFGTYLKQMENQYNEKSNYTAIVTRASVVNILKLEETSAIVEIQTQRTKKKTGNDDLIFEETLTLNWIQQNGFWLVERATWKK